MATTDEPTADECEHCGAPLPPPDATGTRRCSFCRTVTRAPVPPPTPAPGPTPQQVVYVAGPSSVADFAPVNAPRRRGCGCGTLIVLAIIAATVGVPIWIISANGGLDGLIPASPMTFVDASPLLLPAEPTGPQPFVTMVSRYDLGRSTSVYSLVKSDGVAGDPVWSTDLAGQAYGERPILSDGTSALVAVEATVYGVSLATGAVTWTSPLTDVVQFNTCTGCFELYGTTLVVTSTDGNVQAVDTTTGAAQWSRRLESTTNEAYKTGGHHVVVDGTPAELRLVTLDPATGAEVATFTPVCQDPDSPSFSTDLSTSSTMLASTTPDRLWFLDGSSPTCIQQYDVVTGGLVSQALAEDTTGSLTSSPVLLETPLGLVITSYQTLGLVDPSGTTFREVVAGTDEDLVAIGATDAAVIVQVTNRRGTATTSIRAVDPNTGASFWDAPMGAARLVDPDSPPAPNRYTSSSTTREGVYTVHLDGPAVRVLTMKEFDDDSQQLVLDSFDAVTGRASPSVTLDGGSDDIIPDFGPGVWTGSRVLTGVGDDQMQLVDFTTSSVTYELS